MRSENGPLQKERVIPFPAQAARYHADEERERNTVGQQIARARRARGLTLSSLCQLLAERGLVIQSSGISKWEFGASIPNAYQLLALCDALEIGDGLGYFGTGLDQASGLNEAGLRKLEEYRTDLVASGRYKPNNIGRTNRIPQVQMPVSVLPVSAGTGAFLEEEDFEMVNFPESSVPAGAQFGVRVSGDSMEPVYHDGQIVWVQECDSLTPGQVGIFLYDGDGYIKVYGEQEPDKEDAESFTDSYGKLRMQPVLISYNEKYEPRPVSPHVMFRIAGRVLN